MGGQNLRLIHVKGKQSWGALFYFIREDIPIPEDSENRDVQIIHQSSIVGKKITIYSKKVLGIIKELTLVTDAETWIKGLKCVRKEMQELQAHYDGTLEGARRKQIYIEDLNNIFYNNDTTLTF